MIINIVSKYLSIEKLVTMRIEANGILTGYGLKSWNTGRDISACISFVLSSGRLRREAESTTSRCKHRAEKDAPEKTHLTSVKCVAAVLFLLPVEDGGTDDCYQCRFM